MKRKYIVFYAMPGGYGSTDIKVARKERPVSIENIRKIEDILGESLKMRVSVINFKYVGLSWK